MLSGQITHAAIKLFLSLFVLHYFQPPYDYHLIPATHPILPTDRLTAALPALIGAMTVTGWILQLLFNFTSGHFAGHYRLNAVLLFIIGATGLLDFAPALVGKFDGRRALSVQDLLEVALYTVAAYQALSLPPVPQECPDEHID